MFHINIGLRRTDERSDNPTLTQESITGGGKQIIKKEKKRADTKSSVRKSAGLYLKPHPKSSHYLGGGEKTQKSLRV